MYRNKSSNRKNKINNENMERNEIRKCLKFDIGNKNFPIDSF